MTPMIVSMAITAVYMIAGTLIGGALLFAGFHMVKAPENNFTKAAMAAFGIFSASGIAYAMVIRLMDKTDQPLANTAFYAAVGVALAVSYVVTMKFADVEVSKVPMLWGPLAIGLVTILFLVRTEGTKFREKQGFFRGFEQFAYLNMPDPPDAMITPEKAVNYYNQQYGKLRSANEEEGIGKILTTHSRFDLKWFDANWQFIAEKEKERDFTGASTVITSPHAKKGQAIAVMSKPIYGAVQKTWTQGNDALVLMDSGQIVRLLKEGPHWKMRDFLRMRPYIGKEIYEVKKKNSAVVPEDEDLQRWPDNSSEQELKSLASAAGIPYQPFDPFFDEEEKTDTSVADSILGGRKGRGRTTGFAQLDAAKPGELMEIDAAGAPQPAPGAVAAPAGASQQPTVEEKIAQMNSNLDAQAAMLQNAGAPPGSAAGAQVASIPPPSAAMPAMPQFTPAPTDPNVPPAPTPTPFVIDTAPVEVLWPQYFSAVKKIEAGDVTGVTDLMRIVTTEDAHWFEANYRFIADILLPGAAFSNAAQAKLAVLKVMLRNMPRVPLTNRVPAVKRRSGVAVAMADVTEPAAAGTLKYKTALAQENGRWVLAHFFFARNFIWMPQIALYKQARGLPLTPDEQLFLRAGFAPFQQQVKAVYGMVGYGG